MFRVGTLLQVLHHRGGGGGGGGSFAPYSATPAAPSGSTASQILSTQGVGRSSAILAEGSGVGRLSGEEWYSLQVRQRLLTGCVGLWDAVLHLTLRS